MEATSLQFFRLTQAGQFLTIASTGQHGAHGALLVHAKQVRRIFRDIRSRMAVGPVSYTAWADDAYAAGDDAMLVRHDSHDCEDDTANDGRLRIDVAAHPSWGMLVLGDTQHEQTQLQAFLALETLCLVMIRASQPDEATKMRTAQRAKSLIAAATGRTFLPQTGYCLRCGEDVTAGLSDATGLTGCPACGSSWCD